MSEDSFTSKFLKDYKARTNAAHEKAQERARRAAAKREVKEQAEAKAREEHQKARFSAEVDAIMCDVTPRSPWRRRRVKKKPEKPASTTAGRTAQSQPTANQKPGVAGVRVNYRAPSKVLTSRPPGKPGEDMEYVVRRPKEKKEIKVPHTSDYSDMFGDEFWQGVDLEFAKKSAKETAEATAANEKIIAEQQVEREKRKQEREDFFREERKLQRKGLLDERSKNKRRLELSEKDWVAVQVPIPIRLQKGSKIVKQAQEVAAKFHNARRNIAVERVQKAASKEELDERARRLREQIMRLGETTQKKASNARNRTVTNARSRGAKRYVSDSDDSDIEEVRTTRKTVGSAAADGAKKRTTRSDDAVIEEAKQSSDGEGDSDDEDLFHISAIRKLRQTRA